MARGREAVESQDGAPDNVDVGRGNRGELTEQRVEAHAVEPSCTRLELRGIDEVRSADLGDVDLEPGMLAHEHACGSRVIEVNVREQEVTNVGQVEASLGEPRLEERDARARATVEEGRPVRSLEQVCADDVLVLEMDVDRVGRHAASAASRSSMRSSADSMPTESRISVGGTAKGHPRSTHVSFERGAR